MVRKKKNKSLRNKDSQSLISRHSRELAGIAGRKDRSLTKEDKGQNAVVTLTLNQSTWFVHASSSDAREAKKQDEQKASDQVITAMCAEDVTKGPSSELNTQQNSARFKKPCFWVTTDVTIPAHL